MDMSKKRLEFLYRLGIGLALISTKFQFFIIEQNNNYVQKLSVLARFY